MGAGLYFSHGIVFIHDVLERAPGNDWTDDHVAQRFSRRSTACNVATLIEDGFADVDAGSSELLEACERVVAVSIQTDGGAISIGGIDGRSEIIWKGRPGWVRVVLGQNLADGDSRLRMLLMAEEAAREEPTYVREQGEAVKGPFVESAKVALF